MLDPIVQVVKNGKVVGEGDFVVTLQLQSVPTDVILDLQRLAIYNRIRKLTVYISESEGSRQYSALMHGCRVTWEKLKPAN